MSFYNFHTLETNWSGFHILKVSVLKTFSRKEVSRVTTYQKASLKWRFSVWYKQWIIEAVAQRCSVKMVFLEIPQNSQKNTCARVSFLIKLQEACNFIKKETLAQGFSCEFCGISKNTSGGCFQNYFLTLLKKNLLKD